MAETQSTLFGGVLVGDGEISPIRPPDELVGEYEGIARDALYAFRKLLWKHGCMALNLNKQMEWLDQMLATNCQQKPEKPDDVMWLQVAPDIGPWHQVVSKRWTGVEVTCACGVTWVFLDFYGQPQRHVLSNSGVHLLKSWGGTVCMGCIEALRDGQEQKQQERTGLQVLETEEV